MKKLIFSLLLLLPAVAARGQVSVSVPLTVTPPPPVAPPFSVAVSQAVTINGVTYTCAGTLTFTPTGGSHVEGPARGNPVPLKLAGLPDGTPPPMIAGYADAAGNWAAVFAPGDLVYIEGAGWGAAPGKVTLENVLEIPVIAWADREIAIRVPERIQPQPNGIDLDVRRPDGVGAGSMGFRVAAR